MPRTIAFVLPRGRRPATASATRVSGNTTGRQSQLAMAFPRRRAPRADAPFTQTVIAGSTGRRLVLDGSSRLVSPVGTHPLRDAEDIGQPVDRDNEHVLLDSLDAPGANQAHDAERPVACPPSPAPRQPVGLLPHSSDVTCFVRPRLGFDRDDNPRPGDRNGVNVATAMPGQPMPQPPPLRPERGERAPHLAPPSERRLDCDQRATASAERRDPALRRGARFRPAPPPPRSPPQARTARR